MKAIADNILRYTPEIEAIRANEKEVSAQIADTMRRISTAIGDQFRPVMRPVYAKSHGLLRARLTIQSDVPEHYRQGLFAEPGTFDAMVRLSTTPGDILPDGVSSPRAWAIKVIGTPESAVTLPGHELDHTQDFLCQTGKAFGVADAEAFLNQILFFEKHATDSATLKEAVSPAARLAESAIEAVGGQIGTLKKTWLSGDPHSRRILLQPDTPSLWKLHREDRRSFRLRRIWLLSRTKSWSILGATPGYATLSFVSSRQSAPNGTSVHNWQRTSTKALLRIRP
jgi:hypothetical protein